MEEVIKGMAEPPTDKSKETEAQKKSIIEKVNLFYEAVRNGQEPLQALRDKGSERFCILSLAAPAKARLSVRYFTKGSVADLSDNLAQHLRDIGIDRQFLPGHPKRKPDPLYPDLRLILRQTAREYSEIPPLLGAALLRAVLDKTVPYPDALGQAVLRRCSVEHNVNYPKAAILKGWLIRSHLNNSPRLTMSLDTTRKDPAYLYGRMFAVMEQTQAIALGNINASIADRFYSSASSTPGVVFPRLESMFRDHLKKANARYPGMATTRLNLMSEINDKLTDPQNTLNLHERALFAIGYYHQRQALKSKS
jgi:CRISPR-associated protein Csd1